MVVLSTPFCLIAKVLNKIKEDNVKEAILVVPFWPTQTWFSTLISMLIFLPVRLPRHKDLLTLPHTGEMHRKINRLLQKEFQYQIPSSLPYPGENQQMNNINYVGKNGFFGATNGINSLRLSEVDVLCFLSFLLRKHLSYSVVNTHKAMLFQTLPFFGSSLD